MNRTQFCLERSLPNDDFQTSHLLMCEGIENKMQKKERKRKSQAKWLIHWIKLLVVWCGLRVASSEWEKWVNIKIEIEFFQLLLLTNLENKGWISVDRDTRATLTRTIPCSIFKSSTKDLSLPIFELVFQRRLILFVFKKNWVPLQYYDLGLKINSNLFELMIISRESFNKHIAIVPAWILA